MQNAIRDASKRLIKLLESDQSSPRFQQAELDAISSSVALMTYFGEDAKKRTVEQVHNFLKARKKLQLQDIQTGMLAAAMIELQANKQPARDTYQLLDDLLKEDEREEMQQLRLTLQASIRRLDLLGNKFELQAKSLDGKEIATEDFAGQYVLVDFLATWCEPCLLEVPRLKNHYAKYYDRGLRILTISIDEDTEALQQFLAKADLPWPVIHDNAEDPLARLQMKFGVSTLPCILLLNKEGTVVSLEARGAELDRLMQLLFDSPTPAAPPAVSAEPAAAKPDPQ
ncbi:Thiol-disulfide oxidoreductase ResA [Aureliella helgolandensis]|uniref:Thiol-disulfide oxidoreductase ResA n=2 Tax=Aureliella helgolandensis TaxID=2527968 RepID=A0A518GEK5_9BACT|nr:Thiol-disulfide oxidoreductase ResA [Aureliella helgolandensis]